MPESATNTVTMYATWTATANPVKVYPHGGTYNGITSGYVEHSGATGTTVTVAHPTPPKGKTFAGWQNNNGCLAGVSDADPIYEKTDSYGKLTTYANTGPDLMSLSRISDNTVPQEVLTLGSSSTGYKIRVSKAAGTTAPGCGGVRMTGVYSAANQKFRVAICANIPSGYQIQQAHNSCGDGATFTWLTGRVGNGKWRWYVYDVQCGSTGTFSTFSHTYVATINGDNTKQLLGISHSFR